MWSVGSAVVKMKRAMIPVRDDDLSNFKFSAGGRYMFEPEGSNPIQVGGVFLCPCVALAASLVSVIRQRRMCRYVGSHFNCRGGLSVRPEQYCMGATGGTGGVKDAWRAPLRPGGTQQLGQMHHLNLFD